MQYTQFGPAGISVSRLCLGTMTFGLQTEEAPSHAILDAAAEGGINFLDTADVYPLGGTGEHRGRTEEIVGRWLKGRRSRFILATKANGRMGSAPWDAGNSRKHLLDAIDASLKRLQTDYIDLYQLHSDDPVTPLDETLEALDTIVRQGKVRYIGVSNFLAYRLARALGRSEARSLAKFISVQPRYNLLYREIERELLPLCAEDKIAVMVYNPLAGGLLTGKHKRGSAPTEGTRFTLGAAADRYQNRYWHDRMFESVEGFNAEVAKAGIGMTQAALAWVLAHPQVTCAIIGASRAEQLKDTLAAAELKLDPSVKKSLDALSAEYRRGDSPR